MAQGSEDRPATAEQAYVEGAVDRYLHDGRHCSELTFVVPGRAFDPDFDVDLIRIANPFGGGIAEVGDICGAVVGGCMAIGYFFGRRNAEQDQERSWRLAREYHDWFKSKQGFTTCHEKTGGVHNWEMHVACADVVRSSLAYLLDLLRREGLKLNPHG